MMRHSLSEQQIQRAFRAIAACFFMLGWLIPTLFAQFPRIREILGIEEWQITVFILTMAIGAVPSMIISSWAISHIGSKKLAMIFMPLVLIFPVSFVVVPTYPLFLLVGFTLGICTGFFDVSANTQGNLLERVTDRLFMTGIHAMFAAGVLAGTTLAFLSFGGAGWVWESTINLFLGGTSSATWLLENIQFGTLELWQFFGILTLVSASLFFFIRRDFLPVELEKAQDKRDEEGQKTSRPRLSILLLVALSVLMLLGIEAEASHYDWLALYFADEFSWAGSDQRNIGANLAMASFSSGLLIARLSGDKVANWIGRPRLLLFGTLIGIGGLSWLILTQNIAHGYMAAFLMGFGFAFFFPIFVAAGGRLNGIRPAFGVAVVSSMGWASIFIGPPLIGFLEHYYGFRWAYASILPVALIVAIFGPWVVFKSRPENH